MNTDVVETGATGNRESTGYGALHFPASPRIEVAMGRSHYLITSARRV
jgi:hypothetical protein